MDQPIDAIYDHGVFRPLAPLNLPDQARVKLTVDGPQAGSATHQDVGQHEIDQRAAAEQKGDSVAAFESSLDGLEFDGPTLPPNFSRADIYADHD